MKSHENAESEYIFEFPITDRYLSIPTRIWERHLLPDTDSSKVQAIGRWVQVFIESSRDTIAIQLPTTESLWSKVSEHSLNRNGVCISRWREYISTENRDDSLKTQRTNNGMFVIAKVVILE